MQMTCRPCCATLCACVQSLKLGRSNLTFRSVNNRFDIVGGLLYYLLVVRQGKALHCLL